VNTSINAFVYKIEVFKNEVLMDVIEVNCLETYNQNIDNQFFVNTYKQAHKMARDKYCHIEEAKSSDDGYMHEKKENLFLESVVNKKNLLQRVGWGVIFGIVSYIFITKIWIYSDIYIDNFVEAEDKMTYLEQVELSTHRLRKECTFLAQNQENTESLVSAESCQQWCSDGIIDKEGCDLFLAYFFIKTDTKEISKDTDEIHTEYTVFPEEESMEFNVSEVSQLRVYNGSNHQIIVKLKNLHLDNSDNEEIVQFKNAEISLLLREEEGKSFHIFLEPSYYKQFELGIYSGILLFDVYYQNKVIGSIKKHFYFTVK
jgi:hypothetical protein